MDLREISFGVEIKTVKRRRERVARAIQSVVGGDVRHVGSPAYFDPWEVVDDQGRTWKVVSDGSLINVPGHLRAEVVSPVLAYEDIPILQEVIQAVRRCGLTNMLDRPVAADLAEKLGFPDVVRWIETHLKDYAEDVFWSFEAEEGGGR